MKHIQQCCNTLTILLLFLVTAVQAHISMTKPCARFSGVCGKESNLPSGEIFDSDINSPISSATTETYGTFCKTSSEWKTNVDELVAGEPFTVTFGKDGVSHSGGHCEFSISYDGGKTFVVLHQELRYCFVGSQPANPTNQISVYSYTFDVPGDLPSSDHAIFAWSWVNASGNREFYMNCADVSVSGGSSTSYTGKGMTIVNYKGYETLPEFGKNYETGIELYDSKSVSQVTVTGNGGSGGGTKKGSSISSKKNDDSENNNSKVLDEEEVDSASTSSKKPTLVNFKAGVINPSSSKVQFVEDGGTSIDSLEANEKCDVDEVEEDVGKAASFVQDDEEVKCEDDEQLGSVEEDEEIKCEDDEQLGSTEQEEEVKCDEEEGVASPQEQDEQVNQGDEKCDEDEEKKPELADSQDSASTTSPSPSSRSSPSSSASPSSSQSPSSSPSSSPSPTLAMSGVAGPILNADEPMLQCTSPPGPYSFFNPMAGLLLSGVGNTPTSSAVSEIASTSILSPSATLPSSQAQTSELGILDNDESSSPDEFGAEPSITNMDLIPPYIIDNAGSSDMPSSIVDEVAGSSDSFILFEVSTSVAPTSF